MTAMLEHPIEVMKRAGSRSNRNTSDRQADGWVESGSSDRTGIAIDEARVNENDEAVLLPCPNGPCVREGQ